MATKKGMYIRDDGSIVTQKTGTMTKQEATAWIKNHSKGKIFGVNVVKRTGGGLRVMTCRYGVRSRAKGVGLKFNPDRYQLIVIFDMIKLEYRFINIPGLQGLLIAGKFWKVS